jgi:hypothetical protein
MRAARGALRGCHPFVGLTRERSRVIVCPVMAAMFHLELPCCARSTASGWVQPDCIEVANN